MTSFMIDEFCFKRHILQNAARLKYNIKYTAALNIRVLSSSTVKY